MAAFARFVRLLALLLAAVLYKSVDAQPAMAPELMKAYGNKDAKSFANMFTQDAILFMDRSIISGGKLVGRQVIEDAASKTFQAFPGTSLEMIVDRVVPDSQGTYASEYGTYRVVKEGRLKPTIAAANRTIISNEITMADFEKEMVAIGGKLKLKKGGGVTKKKKKKFGEHSVQSVPSKVPKSSTDDDSQSESCSHYRPPDDTHLAEPEFQAPKKTKAQLSFERRQLELQEERVFKKAQLSHRERVEKFNTHMNNMTEFNDIPKVSWTK